MSEYKVLLSFLIERSGLTKDEVEKRLNEKIESLGHLVNEDVALRLVARDLGISLNGESKKPAVLITDIVPNMNNVNLVLIIETIGPLKEFLKKDGSRGSLVRSVVFDDSGRSSLVAWDEQAKLIGGIRNGSRISIRSAYTKSGLRGDTEIHLGNRSKVEVLNVPLQTEDGLNGAIFQGRVWRTSDPITFYRKDGSRGTLVSFQLKSDNVFTRVLVWNPTPEIVADLIEGTLVEIHDGVRKIDVGGKPEIHVNNVESLKVHKDDVVEISRNFTKLSDIKPDMSGMNVQGTVELDFEMTTTTNGKTYLKTLLRDGETILPIILWNEKAHELQKNGRKGSVLVLEDCYSKLGPRGLELGLGRWGKIKIK